MTKEHFLRRRTLRSSIPLVEGAVSRRSSPDTLLVEVSGGPPSVPLDVVIDGHHIRLDLGSDGCGQIRLVAAIDAGPIEIRHRGTVILAGRAPARPSPGPTPNPSSSPSPDRSTNEAIR